MTTLGPSKAHIPRSGAGLRWVKIREQRLAPKAPLTVVYCIWRETETEHLCFEMRRVRDDNREVAAGVVREARRLVWDWELRQAARASKARTRATEARAVARRALG